jgi:zinc protease
MRDDDPAYPALHLSDYVLGASAKSRLLDRLRQKEGLSYGAGSFFMADSQDRDAVFASMAISAPQNAKQAHDSMIDEVEKLVRDGVAPTELEEAKASFALQVKTRLANDSTVAGMLNEGLYLGRTMEYYQKLYDAIQKLKPEDVKKSLQQYVDPKRLVRVQAGDLPNAGS